MKFSIIMPAYNEEKNIKKSIDSILTQTYENFELIIIDDGSLDATYSIIKSYTSKKIKSLKQNNSGVSVARNRGIKEASGDYIIFVDADDSITKDLLYDINMKINHNKKEWFFFKTLKKNNKKELKKYKNNNVKVEEIIKEIIITESINSIWGKVYSRKIIKKNNLSFNQDLLIAEDLLFNLDYLNYVNSITFMNTGYYIYEEDIENSLTSMLDNQKYKSLLEFHKIVDQNGYKTKFNIENELEFIKFKNDYAYLRSLHNENKDFVKQLNYINNYNFNKNKLPNYIWKTIYLIIKTNSILLNKLAIRIIENRF